MRRGYFREAFMRLVEKCREKIPGVAISTDIITGLLHTYILILVVMLMQNKSMNPFNLNLLLGIEFARSYC
jgi:hypothetical protein